MTVDIFIPCEKDGFSAKNIENLLKIVHKVGDTSNIPEVKNICCGQDAYIKGHFDMAKTYAELFLKIFNYNRPLITVSTSCLGYIKKYYNNFFFNSALHLELKQLSKNIFDITEYLVDYKKITNLNAKFEGTVSYFNTCSATEKCNIQKQPIVLLQNVNGLNLTEYKNNSCCGFGNNFSKKFPEHSEQLALEEIKKMLDLDTQYITSTDASCLAHLQKVIDRKKLKIKTIHIVDILASEIDIYNLE